MKFTKPGLKKLLKKNANFYFNTGGCVGSPTVVIKKRYIYKKNNKLELETDLELTAIMGYTPKEIPEEKLNSVFPEYEEALLMTKWDKKDKPLYHYTTKDVLQFGDSYIDFFYFEYFKKDFFEGNIELRIDKSKFVFIKNGEVIALLLGLRM